jgi:hypothetical protein
MPKIAAEYGYTTNLQARGLRQATTVAAVRRPWARRQSGH